MGAYGDIVVRGVAKDGGTMSLSNLTGRQSLNGVGMP